MTINNKFNQSLYFARLYLEQARLHESQDSFQHQQAQCYIDAAVMALFRAVILQIDALAEHYSMQSPVAELGLKSAQCVPQLLEKALSQRPIPEYQELAHALCDKARLLGLLVAHEALWQVKSVPADTNAIQLVDTTLSSEQCDTWYHCLSDMNQRFKESASEY